MAFHEVTGSIPVWSHPSPPSLTPFSSSGRTHRVSVTRLTRCVSHGSDPPVLLRDRAPTSNLKKTKRVNQRSASRLVPHLLPLEVLGNATISSFRDAAAKPLSRCRASSINSLVSRNHDKRWLGPSPGIARIRSMYVVAAVVVRQQCVGCHWVYHANTLSKSMTAS